MSTRWHIVGRTTGWRSTLFVTLTLLISYAWLCWPLISSLTVPARDELTREFPFVLCALLTLTCLVGFGLWLDVERHLANVAPIPLLVGIGLGIRLLLTPGASGIEPVFWIPMLAGLVLGSAAGWITGVATMCLIALATGNVAAPLLGQLIVMGTWGVVGGWLHRLRTLWAWLASIIAMLPLGVLTGVALNLMGWASEGATDTNSFVPGLGAVDTLARIWQYTLDTSAAYDGVRVVTNMCCMLVAGIPMLRFFRSAYWAAEPEWVDEVSPPPTIAPSALTRRRRSALVDSIWDSTKENAS